ncbi:50S ribosomal protein L1 [Sphaerosporella brunnea]|uniref:50S ribosomal protein L1 n=1 Tax=Sphaerosporella brunnea TaxID=1250544 RepID=A0A5J5F802_9PEZI|nr:50S ribosomal protein L1 [Sphaerosporella brunnea]
MPPRPRLQLSALPTPSSILFSSRPAPAVACLRWQVRNYAAPQKKPSGNKKSRGGRTHFKPTDLSQIDQFSLLEAMRYIQAFEVGHDPVATKYELHVKLRTQKSGPTVKSRIRLPKPVKTDLRICVIAEGKQAEAAKAAGASLVGTQEVFEKIQNGEIDFDKCICHEGSFAALIKARLGPILGPKGLMPSQKLGTVVLDVAKAMKELTGASEYRERMGVIRVPIGQIAFTEQELAKNIKAFMEQLKKEFGAMSFRADKSINEVVLSSTRSPGFSLSGEFMPVAET